MIRYPAAARSFIVSLLILAVAAAGCGDGSDDGNGDATQPPSTATAAPLSPTAAPEPTAAPATPGGAPTSGIDAVDAAIAAVLAGDADAVRELIVYTPTACAPQMEGIGAPPVCAEGEAEGTLVDVLPVAQCEGYFVRPADIGEIAIPVEDASLYAVYDRGDDEGFPNGRYVVVFEAPAPNNNPGIWAWALMMTDDGVTGIHHGCASSPESFVEFQQLTDAIIPPSP